MKRIEGLMKEIQKNYLNQIQKEYLKKDIYSVARHALNNHMIMDIIKVIDLVNLLKTTFP